jgi:predicted transcriptional regulator
MRAALALLVLLASAASAAAAPVSADLQVTGPAAFQGRADASVGWVGAIHDGRLGHTARPAPIEAAADAALLTYRYAVEESDPSSPTGYGAYRVLVARDEVPLGAVRGALEIRDAGHSLGVRVVPDAPMQVQLPPAGFGLRAPLDFHQLLQGRHDAQPPAESAATYPPPGSALVLGSLAVGGDVAGTLAVTDAVVDVGGASIDTRWGSVTQDLPGVAAAGVQETRVLVLRGTFRLPPLAADAWTAVAGSLAGRLHGDLALANAQGSALVNGTQEHHGLHLFQAVGDLDVTASLGPPSAAWTVQGEADFVAVNAAAAFGERWPAAAAVAAGAGLLAAVAWLARFLFAGRNVADPVANGKRLKILGLISREPGITVPQIVQGAGVRRSSARHHLRILERGRLVTRRPIGKTDTFTLNNATFDFALGGSGAVAGEAFGLMAHPARRQVVQAIRGLGAASYEDLRRKWESDGVRPLSRALASYHCRQMLREGLLEKARDGRRSVWSLRFDADAARRHQRTAYLSQGPFAPIAEALRHGPCDAEALRRRSSGMSWEAFDRSLRVLLATGHVRRDGAAYALADPPGR